MKKDKRSKANYKSPIDRIHEAIAQSAEPYIYPFDKYADQLNPFVMPFSKFSTPKKAHVYQLAIDSIAEFGSECTDHRLWDFGEKILIKKKISALNKQIKEITNQLKSLIPTEANETRKTSVIRMTELVPEGLVEQVEVFKLRLEDYDLNQTKKSLKIKGNRFGRKQAIKIFMEKTLTARYQKIVLTDTRSNTNIALSFFAKVKDCNYDVLRKIYCSIPLKRRTEIHDYIGSSTKAEILFLQKVYFIQAYKPFKIGVV